jgi:acetyl esterase/lipase
MTVFGRREFLALGGASWAMRSSAGNAARLSRRWTDAESFPIWPAGAPGASQFTPQAVPEDWRPDFLRNIAQPRLHVFRPARPNGKAFLVVPGGSYAFISVHNEGLQIAERLSALGLTVFVLTYRLPAEGWTARADVPLQDAQRALRVIRARATHFGIDAGTVSVAGFSAGGHLAATLATRHHEQVYERQDAADDASACPFTTALVYPVITLQAPFTHEWSRRQLLGEQPSEADVERRSAELHVDRATPPIFIVHAMDDGAVPVENSLLMMDAMRAAKRPIEAHLLQEGGHGFGAGHADRVSGRWIDCLHLWWSRWISTDAG